MLLVDATGVGDPVVELLDLLNMPVTLIAVSITGGNQAHADPANPWHWHVPKHLLVESFETVLRENRFEWPRGLRDPVTREDMKAVLLGEVTQYRAKIKNPKRPKSYAAASGCHDVDGLQHRCATGIFGELDWSPGIHQQCVWRLDREGQKNPVTAFFLVTDDGSDPPMMDVLGIKASEAQSIVDPHPGRTQISADQKQIAACGEDHRHRWQSRLRVRAIAAPGSSQFVLDVLAGFRNGNWRLKNLWFAMDAAVLRLGVHGRRCKARIPLGLYSVKHGHPPHAWPAAGLWRYDAARRSGWLSSLDTTTG